MDTHAGPAPRFVRPLHHPRPDEPVPSRSPRRRGADRDGTRGPSRVEHRAADGNRPRAAQNHSAG